VNMASLEIVPSIPLPDPPTDEPEKLFTALVWATGSTNEDHDEVMKNLLYFDRYLRTRCKLYPVKNADDDGFFSATHPNQSSMIMDLNQDFDVSLRFGRGRVEVQLEYGCDNYDVGPPQEFNRLDLLEAFLYQLGSYILEDKEEVKIVPKNEEFRDFLEYASTNELEKIYRDFLDPRTPTVTPPPEGSS
jgi:hypothetical protein